MYAPDVKKIGGSLLDGPESFRSAAAYVAERGGVVVTSAMKGVTNRLIKIFDSEDYDTLMCYPGEMYEAVVDDLPSELKDSAMTEIERRLAVLPEYIRGGMRDAFVGSGEEHSSILLSYHLTAQGKDNYHKSGPETGFYLDSHGLIDNERSRECIQRSLTPFLDEGTVAVVGGYLGYTIVDSHKQYKLGESNINDAFAAEIASALKMGKFEILKNVPGVYVVTPEFPQYGLVSGLSYDEAANMSWRGSPVVHPNAIQIAENDGIVIVVKDMKSEGTTISSESHTTIRRPYAALVPQRIFMITVLDRIMATRAGNEYASLINEYERRRGNTMPTLSKTAGSLSYTMIGDIKRNGNDSQTFERHKEDLRHYLKDHGFNPTVEGREVGEITIVGDGMRNRTGTFAELASVLGEHKISIGSTTQTPEEYTNPVITFLVRPEDLDRTVEALGKELFRE